MTDESRASSCSPWKIQWIHNKEQRPYTQQQSFTQVMKEPRKSLFFLISLTKNYSTIFVVPCTDKYCKFHIEFVTWNKTTSGNCFDCENFVKNYFSSITNVSHVDGGTKQLIFFCTSLCVFSLRFTRIFINKNIALSPGDYRRCQGEKPLGLLVQPYAKCLLEIKSTFEAAATSTTTKLFTWKAWAINFVLVFIYFFKFTIFNIFSRRNKRQKRWSTGNSLENRCTWVFKNFMNMRVFLYAWKLLVYKNS